MHGRVVLVRPHLDELAPHLQINIFISGREGLTGT